MGALWRRTKGRTSFLKKRSKKLLIMGAALVRPARDQGPRVFWFFFSKKNILPAGSAGR
jgi:hypothetical protein